MYIKKLVCHAFMLTGCWQDHDPANSLWKEVSLLRRGTVHKDKIAFRIAIAANTQHFVVNDELHYPF